MKSASFWINVIAFTIFMVIVIVAPSMKEAFSLEKSIGMPLDVQASGMKGMSAQSPILGVEPKPLSAKPYDEMVGDTTIGQFRRNRVGADCCPSPFVSDRGCICLTEKDLEELRTRGGNRLNGTW